MGRSGAGPAVMLRKASIWPRNERGSFASPWKTVRVIHCGAAEDAERDLGRIALRAAGSQVGGGSSEILRFALDDRCSSSAGNATLAASRTRAQRVAPLQRIARVGLEYARRVMERSCRFERFGAAKLRGYFFRRACRP